MGESFRVEHRPICASTSDALKEIVQQEGSSNGLFLFCDEQPQGRGRRTRDWWLGPPTENLAFSCAVFEPPNPLECLAVLAAVSLAELLAENTHQEIGLKWPNDVLVNNQKIAGILAELVTDPFQNSVGVIGIGLNLHSSPPASLVNYPTTHFGNWVENIPSREDLMRAWWGIFSSHQRELQDHGPACLEAQFLSHLQVWGTPNLHHPKYGTLGSPSEFSFAEGLLCEEFPHSIATTQLDGLSVKPYPSKA